MNATVAVNPAQVKPMHITADNAAAIGQAYQFGISDGRKGDDADEIFFTGELLTAYRLGFEVGQTTARIEADITLNVWM